MRLGRLAVYLCVTAVGASMVEYQGLCPDLHETKLEITHGEWVIVKCGSVGSHDGKKSQIAGISSPVECAQLCTDDVSCTHSSWGISRKCLLSGTKFAEREISKSVLLVKTLPDDHEDECPEDDPYCDDEECDEPLCEEQLEESNSQLENCETKKETCHSQLNQCLTEKQVLLEELSGAPSTELGSENGQYLSCDDSHGTIFTALNDRSFKIHCSQGTNSHPFKTYKSETFARCVDECAYHHDCKAAEFVKSGRREGYCQLYHLGKGDSEMWVPRETRASAVLIGE